MLNVNYSQTGFSKTFIGLDWHLNTAKVPTSVIYTCNDLPKQGQFFRITMR